ncbi:hypothetical protein ACP4OV_023476 [Aristida adscensionis]
MASLAILLLMARLSSSIAVSSSSISRSVEQQVIANVSPAVIPDTDGQGAQPFLTSPSGTYAAYLRRAVDGAGGLGGDACYVQIQQVGGEGDSAWESDCTPVGGADACDLAFSPVGLELFAGGHSLWDTGLDGGDPGTLSLDDGGDMTIVSKEGVTVWKASGEPWTGQQCGAPLPALSTSTSPSTDALPQPSTASTDALPPPSANSTGTLPPPSSTSEKLVTPPADTLAGPGSTDFSFGDQPAAPPVDALPEPDLPAQPPVDMSPVQPLAPPPAYTSPDSPDLPLPPPPAYTFPDSPDQPLPPSPADMSPDQPLYSSPPPAPAATGMAPMPPFGMAPLFPPTGTPGETSPGATTPPTGEPDSPGGLPFSAPSPVGTPHGHGSPHHLPAGASPPLPDALAPGGGNGAGAGLPFGQGQQPGRGVFGQQPQLLNGEGQPLEESAAGRSPGPGHDHRVAAVCLALASLVALGFGF